MYFEKSLNIGKTVLMDMDVNSYEPVVRPSDKVKIIHAQERLSGGLFPLEEWKSSKENEYRETNATSGRSVAPETGEERKVLAEKDLS